MNEIWPLVTLQDVTTILGDGLHGTPKYDAHGDYYFINGNNLSDGRIVVDYKTKRAPEEEYLKYKKNLNDRTILVSINGTIGNVAIYNGENIFLDKSACYFNVKDDVDKHYIRYIVSGPIFQNYIHSLATGSTIKNVSLRLMRDFAFPLPPLVVQTQISKTLKELDDKIHLNTQINQTLEQIAQAIFKSWFVDFDPVKAKMAVLESGGTQEEAERAAMGAISGKDDAALKAFKKENPEGYAELEETAALFPAGMVESELGFTSTGLSTRIPEGWEVKSFGSLCRKVESGGTPKRSEISYWNGEIKWLSSGEVRNVIILNTKERISVAGLNNSSAKLWPKFSTAVAMYGATAGQVCLLANEMTANQACCALIPKDEFACYTFLAARRSIQSLSGKASGSAQQNLNKGIVQNHPVVRPASKVALQFDSRVKSILQRWIQNDAESAALSETRDTLLPRLLSGEIEIKKSDGVAS